MNTIEPDKGVEIGAVCLLTRAAKGHMLEKLGCRELVRPVKPVGQG